MPKAKARIMHITPVLLAVVRHLHRSKLVCTGLGRTIGRIYLSQYVSATVPSSGSHRQLTEIARLELLGDRHDVLTPR